MSKFNNLDLTRVPAHIAIIMDGNGRWAQGQGKDRTFGHWSGVESVRDSIEGAVEAGVKILTLYAFSTENWIRPVEEVNILMEILVSSIHHETENLMKNGIRLQAFGQLDALPESCRKELFEAIDATASNSTLTLNLALSYGSRWEILNAIRIIAGKIEADELKAAEVNEELFNSFLCTAGMPDPDLLIRTSGEQRISNFLLWQIAYSELYFTPKFWPDFRRDDLFEAIYDFQNRKRRFGSTSEQLIESKISNLG